MVVVDSPSQVLVHESMMHYAALESGGQRADRSVQAAVVMMEPDYKASAFDQVAHMIPANCEHGRKMLHLMAVIAQKVANAVATEEVSAQVIFLSQTMELVAKTG